METISFEDLGLDATTLAAVSAKGFTEPTPIQILAIPRLLNGDANVIARARTGTGKTAAFGLPLVQTIRDEKPLPRALILTPTRELALQVCKEIESLSTGRYPRLLPVYGGQSMSEQLRRLKSGIDVVVGTPGRVKDHLDRGSLKLAEIDYFILDEADEMLDMGFIEDIELIFSKANPASRVLLFSATMPQAILKIARKFMGEYEIVEEDEHPEEPILTEQRYFVVRESDKIEALTRIIDAADDFYGLIFTQTKADADMVSRELDERGYAVAAMHGDIPQSQREKILGRFRNKKTRILAATDVAARGIDIEGLTHVINYALPFDGPTYIHRIGRTGRAGAKGLAFTLVRPEERRRVDYIRGVSKGNLKEAQIPSIAEVLVVKKDRLFAQVQANLENAIGEHFTSFASDLCKDKDPTAVLASLLAMNYGDDLNPDRYRDISVAQNKTRALSSRAGDYERSGRGGGNRSNGDSGELAPNQTRLYIGLGRRDGAGRREIAQFFGDLLGIPERLVDRIEITENFSLATLPTEAAHIAMEMGKQNHTLPHLHIDIKANAGSGGFLKSQGGDSRPRSRAGSSNADGSQYRRRDAGSSAKAKTHLPRSGERARNSSTTALSSKAEMYKKERR